MVQLSSLLTLTFANRMTALCCECKPNNPWTFIFLLWKKNPTYCWDSVIYTALAFPGAKKVEKSTPCAWEAALCSSINRTLSVADHFNLILRASSGRIHKNMQLCTVNIHVMVGQGRMVCLKNGLFGFLLLDLSLDWNKKKWREQLVLLVAYCTNAHCSATQTAMRPNDQELVLSGVKGSFMI